MSPGHLAVTRAGPRGGLSPGSHLGCPHRSEFRPAAAGDRVAGRAAACREEPPSHRTQAPLQHRGTGERTGRSAFWRRGAVRPRVCRGSQGAGTPGPGVPGTARGLLAAHPGISLGRPAGVRPSARLPAGVPPPSPGPPSATHRFPGCSRAARWTRSAPPPRPPEALLPPRGPRAQPPPGARPRSASPCAATRPGRWGGRGRALRVAELSASPPPGAGANPCARALASRSSPRTVSVMNSQVHPHGGVGLLFKPVPLFSILVSRADSPVLYSFIFFIPRVLHRLSIRLPPHPHPTHLLV